MSAMTDALASAGLPLTPLRMSDVLISTSSGYKRCTDCLRVKSIDQFGLHHTGYMGRRPTCKACHAAAQRRYRERAA